MPTALRGDFAQARGEGSYSFLAALFIPSGTGVVTLQFEPFGRPATDYTNFLHLDFMPDNTVRVDDGETRFGTFPRDQLFTLSAQLNISATATQAHFQLFGTGASGDLNHTVTPALQNIARQFGAVKFWMGFPHTGVFNVDDVFVTFRK